MFLGISAIFLYLFFFYLPCCLFLSFDTASKNHSILFSMRITFFLLIKIWWEARIAILPK